MDSGSGSQQDTASGARVTWRLDAAVWLGGPGRLHPRVALLSVRRLERDGLCGALNGLDTAPPKAVVPFEIPFRETLSWLRCLTPSLLFVRSPSHDPVKGDYESNGRLNKEGNT